MASVKILRKVDYLCNSRNIIIEAECPIDGRYIAVRLMVDGKLAYSSYYTTPNSFPTKQEEYDSLLNEMDELIKAKKNGDKDKMMKKFSKLMIVKFAKFK